MSWFLVLILVCVGVIDIVNGDSQPPKVEEPKFLAPVENLTVAQGGDATFSCAIGNLGSHKVGWLKADSKAILTVDKYVVAMTADHYSASFDGENTWKLTIRNVQQNDSGTYMCQTNTDPSKSQMGSLKVLVPADIPDEDETADTVAVEEVSREKQGPSPSPSEGEEPEFLAPVENLTVVQGDEVTFHCKIKNLGFYKVAWIMPDYKKLLTIDKYVVARNAQHYSVSFDEENTWQLTIRNVEESDSGAYMCQTNTNSLKSQMGSLKVVVPTDIPDEVETADAAAVEEVSREKQGPSPTEVEEPEFLAPVENLTVVQGDEITFYCKIENLGSYKVAWWKFDSTTLLAVHKYVIDKNAQHYSVHYNGEDTWMLTIKNVQESDSGLYMCQINTNILKSQMGSLKVLTPPEEEEPTDYQVEEGGSVRMRCATSGRPEPTVTWRREDSQSIVLRADPTRQMQVVRQFEGDSLRLTDVRKKDIGAYLCTVNNGILPPIRKRFFVHMNLAPVTKVRKQLVVASTGSDVVLQCYVEAYPKANHFWSKLSGEILFQSAKYIIEEVQISDFSTLLNLTIRSVAKEDFGGYICSSCNSLTMSEGRIQLLELV